MANDVSLPDQHVFAVGSVIVDPKALELRSNEGVSTVELKVMDLLRVLAERPGEVWNRDILMDRIWGQSAIGDENLTRVIYLLRKALSHPHGQDEAIKTIPKRGYQLRLPAADTITAPAPTPSPDWDIVVLPFENIGAQSDDQFLADGLCRDLTNLLSRTPTLRVVPISSAMQFGAKNGSDRFEGIAPEVSSLNVRYQVSGSFQRRGRMIRLRVRLIDRDCEDAIWEQKRDAELDDFFEVQDDLVRSITTAVNSEIETASLKSVFARGEFIPSLYEHLYAAEAERWSYNRESVASIIRHLEAALAIYPKHALANAGMAVQLAQNLVNGWADEDFATLRTKAERHLQIAQTIDPQHPDVLVAAGIVKMFSGQNETAIPYLERAISLNPTDPHARALLGRQRCGVFRAPDQIALIESAERDAPYHRRFALWANYRGLCHLRLGQYHQALVAFEECAVRDPGYAANWIHCAIPLVLLGRHADASEKIAEGIRMECNLDKVAILSAIETGTTYHPEGLDIAAFMSGLRHAWPD